MSQILDGVKPVDYLNEGLSIMRDARQHIEKIKSNQLNAGRASGLDTGIDEQDYRAFSGSPGSKLRKASMAIGVMASLKSRSGLSALTSVKKRKNIQNVINSVKGSKLPSLHRKSISPERDSQYDAEQDENVQVMREGQLQRLEGEYLKFQRRFKEVTDPQYVMDIQN